MSTTITTATLETSNVRGSSSKTRNLPARTSRNPRSSLRQNSLLSVPASAQGAPQPEPEPHGFYPAITHFTDAITALPRDFRRHTSLLKEVDAKAWALEENLQKLLQQCLHERQTYTFMSGAQTVAGSVSSTIGDNPTASIAGSIMGNVLDTASQYSSTSVDHDIMRRRRIFGELRQNLMQMIMPLDEKNHVINNANEELSKHIRRQDEIWPHIAQEISEETRLGSLRHWALVDLNPTKKTVAATARGREALLPDNEVAERSERRREAVALAKKQKTAPQLADSDAEARRPTRKGVGRKVQETEDLAVTAPPVTLNGSESQLVKSMKNRAVSGKAMSEIMKKSTTNIGSGSVAMSRENSQQENPKKRKAPTSAATVARKRYVQPPQVSHLANETCRVNATTQESPKLAQSPLAATFGKDVHKKSPALSNVRPVNGRGRQTSTQQLEPSNRPPSSASRRNGVNATGTELERVTAATGKTVNEVKQTMKETITSKGEKMLEEDVPDSVDNRMRGGILLERTGSKSSQLRRQAQQENSSGRRTASPRLHAALPVESNRNGKGRNKNSTPVLGTFTEPADMSESTPEVAGATAENGGSFDSKLKRPARPRIKDHHGLHDSLSPKGLPTKRQHKKNSSYSATAALSARRDADDEAPAAAARKPAASRTNSRLTKNNSDGREVSSTPKIGGPTTDMVEEPDSLLTTSVEDVDNTKSTSRRNGPRHASSLQLDVKPPGTNSSKPYSPAPTLKKETESALGSPGPEVVHQPREPPPSSSPPLRQYTPVPLDQLMSEDEEDPNEQRYCYCGGVSYGEMVACDNDDCLVEWFHLECTGLRSLPPARSKWYCNVCKAKMVR